jgi:hypothetical protein
MDWLKDLTSATVAEPTKIIVSSTASPLITVPTAVTTAIPIKLVDDIVTTPKKVIEIVATTIKPKKIIRSFTTTKLSDIVVSSSAPTTVELVSEMQRPETTTSYVFSPVDEISMIQSKQENGSR